MNHRVAQYLCAAFIGISCLVHGQPVAKNLTFENVIATARDHASKPFSPPTAAALPEELRGDKLNYDSYREIHFRHDRALWLNDNLSFRLEFFHPGYLYQTPVSLYEFNASHVQPIRFVQDFFDYGNLKLPRKIPAETGYAGFRLLYRLNAPDRWDEVGSFLGASYFRCLGKDQSYGQSARGLALNCGEPDRPEEFPIFTSWWLARPEKENNTLRLYAILDSASCAGAYELLLRPGENTVVDIDAVLFLRAATGSTNGLKTVGIAPLTSMFWFGENSQSKPDDYRPEVHDSDGLLVRQENNDFIWCPLKNPSKLEHITFPAPNPRGFGLMQRDRELRNYQDFFNSYHRVPSVWVEPRGNWGEGEIHLVQLPGRSEGEDNIVAFWNPANRREPLEPYRFGSTLFWTKDPNISEHRAEFPMARASQTRTGLDPKDRAKRQFVIDFSGTQVPSAKPHAQVTASTNAAISSLQVFENPLSKGWRVFFSVKPDAQSKESVDIQCWLEQPGVAPGKEPNRTNATSRVSETWRYFWSPN